MPDLDSGPAAGHVRAGVPADGVPGRERILAAAEKLFAEYGFDRTSTTRIAAEARVPQGLIFYHFTTKMDLLLAVVRGVRVSDWDDLGSALDDGTDLFDAVRAIWSRLSDALGEPSAVRRIVFQELASHPEVRQRASELHDEIAGVVGGLLARATGHLDPLPEHEAAAHLLTIAAGMAPLLGGPGQAMLNPGAIAAVIADGLTPTRRENPESAPGRGR